jgi:hypothetical protein
MNGQDLRYLADRADTVRGRPDQRLAEVHARIRSARRRRAVEAIAGTSAAVLAIVVGIAVLTGPTAPTKRNAPPPPANSDTPASSTTRKLVYSDDLRVRTLKTSAGDGVPDILVGALHVGDREVEIDQKVLMSHGGWTMVVTDAGAAYVKVDHSVWVTDGGRPQQIAQQTCADTSGDWRGLATGSAGSLVAWFDCSAASRRDLVVYDTSLHHEVARQNVRSCRAPGLGPVEGPYGCVPDGVIGEHVYFGHINRSGRLVDHQFRLDVPSGKVIPAGPAVYADDLRTHPRALVIGDSWRAGTASDDIGAVVFHVVGARLAPVVFDNASDTYVRTRAFDSATGQPVLFRLPAGYHPDPAAGFHQPGERLEGTDTFIPFEWLDDDTVALAQGGINWVGAVITCHPSDGHCDLAVNEPPHNRHRIAPGLGLPG